MLSCSRGPNHSEKFPPIGPVTVIEGFVVPAHQAGHGYRVARYVALPPCLFRFITAFTFDELSVTPGKCGLTNSRQLIRREDCPDDT